MPLVHRKNNFIWLTLSLVGLMIMGAATGDIPDSASLLLIEYTIVALLLVSLLSLKYHRAWSKAFLIIIGLILVSVVARSATKSDYFQYTYLAFLAVFLLAAARIVGKEVLLTGKVDLNIVVGSIALYMIIGYIYSIIYVLLLEIYPGAINGIEPGPWYDTMPTVTYFSFVTLTTLGYGDITPASPLAQVIVIIEAVTGLFYLAAIVASLIGSLNKPS